MSFNDVLVDIKAKSIYKSVWLFPLVLFIVVITLSTFKISGSSIGELGRLLLPGDTTDNSLLFNHPRNLRSDEWSVNTPLIASQEQNEYSLYSQQLGVKNDTAIVSDLPSRDWTIIFKPQNIAFLIGIPFDIAFAFRWWIMGYILILATYFFILHLFPNKRLLAIIISLSLFFSPIIQWWYQNINILLVAFFLFSLLFFMKLVRVREKNIRQKTIYAASLTWSLLSFALILYPPYQIPLTFILLAAIIGYSLSQHTPVITLLKVNYIYLLSVLGIVFLVLAGFYITHKEALRSLSNTSYPGSRHILAGGFPIGHILSPQLAPIFVNEDKSAKYYPEDGLNNSSESSQLGLPTMTVILFGLFISLIVIRRTRRIPWMTVSMLLSVFAIITRLFVPHFNFIYKLILIDTIPHQRLMLGLCFAVLLLAVFSIYDMVKSRIHLTRLEAVTLNSINIILSVALLLFIYKFQGWMLDNESVFVISLNIIIPVLFCLFLTIRWYTLGFFTLLIFVILSTISVNPLYVGLGPAKHSEVSNYVRELSSKHDARWVTDIDNVWQLESLVLLNGGKSLSGIYLYPQTSIWQSINSSPEAYTAFNRFAHVIFMVSSGESRKTTLKYESPMHFTVNLTPCSDFLSRMDVGYILTPKKISSDCSELLKEFHYKHQTLYTYQLTN